MRFLLTVLSVGFMGTTAAAAATCGFVEKFSRADEGGRTRVSVFEGRPEPALGGVRPLAFVSSLKVNTDGTRISYKADDPRAKGGAINDMRNAMLAHRTIAEFEAVAKAGWPLPRPGRC